MILFLSLGLLGSREMTPGEVAWRDAVGYRKEGMQLQQAGDLRNALTAYRKAITVYPVYAEAYNDWGVILESLGDVSKAEEAYKTALRLKPEFASAHSNLALLYEETGRIKEASEHWATRLRLGPPEDPWVRKARESLRKYNLPVPQSAEETARLRREEAQKAVRAGQAHLEARRWAEAEKEFSRAVSLDPTDKSAARLVKVARSKIDEQDRQRRRDLELARTRMAKEAELARRQTAKPAPVVAAKPPEAPKGAPIVAVTPPVPADAQALAREYAREKGRTRQKSVKELSQRAVAASREGQYQTAIDLYQQILILEPGDRDAQQGLKRAKKALAKQEAQAGAGS